MDWDRLEAEIIKKLKELKNKYPFLNRHIRKRHAQDILENFKKGKWQLSTDFMKDLIEQLESNFDIVSKREKDSLGFTIDLLKVVQEIIKHDEEKGLIAVKEKKPIEKEEIKKEAIEVKEKYGGMIGRVSLSQRTPATPSTFFFWIKDDIDLHVEPGTIVTVEGIEEKIVGIVEDVKACSDVPTSINEFYSTGYGNPEEELAIERPVIREANAHVVKRSNMRVEPIMRKWPVYFANREEIIEAYAGHIKDKDRILMGFTFDEKKQPVPVYADFHYIFGYKGAHLNIAGSSGLAAKTSYALFLICSALAYARRHDSEDIGIIAFNVKERDLLNITKFTERFSDLNEVIENLEKKTHPHIKKSAELWEEASKCKINPFEVLRKDNVKVLEPDKDYKYGLADIIELGGNTADVLKMLFDPQDIDDNFEALLSGIVEEFRDKSFDDVKREIKSRFRGGPRSLQKATVNIGDTPIHMATIAKFLRRLEVATEQLRKILENKTPRVGTLKRIPIDKLISGQIFIINIEPLPDRGKRLVFLSILKTVNKILEAKKEGIKKVRLWNEERDISSFPNKVAIFIDELNKFAPRGREFSPIKHPIIDIAARGRSLGLSLIGAEQMASQIDEEILANCSTFIVGRSHPVEIRDKSYDWIKGDLRDRITILKPGEIIMFHALHNAPVLINFPIPIHKIEEEE